MATETELKFAVDAGAAAALEAALRQRGALQKTIRSRYFDTADRRLAAERLALRLRKAGGAWEQTLKAPGPRSIVREEETVARPGKWGPGGPDIDLALHSRTRAGKALAAALHGSDAAAAGLVPVHESVLKRLAVEVEVDAAQIELAFDRGTIRAGAQTEPLCEIEYELKGGSPAGLIAFAKADVARHRLWLRTLSKAARADRLAHGPAVGLPIKTALPRVAPDADGAALFRAVVAACLEQVIGNAAEIGEGHRDDELVHQLRIGIRRLRTAARELAALAEPLTTDWEPALTQAFRRLGACRDRQVVAPAVEARLRAAGSPSPSIPLSISAASGSLPDPLEIVRDPAFQCALLDVLALTFAPAEPAAAARSAADAKRLIGDRLSRLRRQLRRGAKDFMRLDEEGQHRVRKRLKRLRYLSELVAPPFPRRRVRSYLDALKPAQDAVGGHVDLLLSRHAARGVSEAADPRAWFNVGWLGAEIAHSGKRAKKALERAGAATPFW